MCRLCNKKSDDAQDVLATPSDLFSEKVFTVLLKNRYNVKRGEYKFVNNFKMGLDGVMAFKNEKREKRVAALFTTSSTFSAFRIFREFRRYHQSRISPIHTAYLLIFLTIDFFFFCVVSLKSRFSPFSFFT